MDETEAESGAPGTSDRKRKRDHPERSESATRRSFHDGSSSGVFNFKILVPNSLAGSIIGKGGEVVARLKEETGIKLRMGKGVDLFPGTTDRACMLTGSRDAILAGLSFILKRIFMKQKTPSSGDVADEQIDESETLVVKLAVPYSTAGMIIGKGGQNVKQIIEKTGSHLQLSQKNSEIDVCGERCVAISGNFKSVMAAFELILGAIMKDPNSGSFPNVNYHSMYQGGGEGDGSMRRGRRNGGEESMGDPSSSLSCRVEGGARWDVTERGGGRGANHEGERNSTRFRDHALSNGDFAGLQLVFSVKDGVRNIVNSAMLDGVKAALLAEGRNQIEVMEILGALTNLSSRGVLGLAYYGPNTNRHTHQAPQPAQHQPNQPSSLDTFFSKPKATQSGSPTGMGMGYGTGYQESSHSSGYMQPPPPPPLINTQAGPSSDEFVSEMVVPESLVEFVFGNDGGFTAEIERMTGASIRMSMRRTEAGMDHLLIYKGASDDVQMARQLTLKKVTKLQQELMSRR